jgi:hypothetical protein
MEHRAFTDLLASVEQHLLDHPPVSLHHKRARHRILRRGPLSLSDRLLVTVLRHRWKTQVRALTFLLGSPANAVGDAVLAGLRQSRDSSYSSEAHITSQRHMAALIQVGR